MIQWVRLWHDMPTDPKWRIVARRSKRPISEVISVFCMMMLNAGDNAEERGCLKNWDDEDAAATLDIETEHVAAIREAMQGKTLTGDTLSGWHSRQPKREDGASERARAWRERRKCDEGQRDNEANANERIVEDANECLIDANATERNRTQPNATERPEKRREDKIREDKYLCPTAAQPRRTKVGYPDEFEEFWSAYPTDPIMSKKKAFEQWARLPPDDRPEALAAVPGFRSYCSSHPDYRPVHADRFLSQRRFEQINATKRAISCAASQATVRVDVGTPQWDAWDLYYREKHKKSAPSANGKWFFPTAWPPEFENPGLTRGENG